MGNVRAVHHVQGLYVRECKPSDSVRGSVLFVHGATVASGLFDIAVPGYSMLEAIANQGWWSFAFDLRGYARSQRPATMALAPRLCPVVCSGEDALADVHKVIGFVRQHTGAFKISLLGGSWGSVVAARYAQHNSLNLNSLTLLAPLYGTINQGWLDFLRDVNDPTILNRQLGGYRFTTQADLLSRWDPEIPDAQKSSRRDPRVLQALMQDETAADPTSPVPSAFRVPNGTLRDLFSVFQGTPLYDPKDIQVPCLLVRGSDDQTSTAKDAQLLLQRLGTKDKQLITIPNAGHFMQAEKQAPTVQAAIARFLARTA
jgi:alpha-beta hydrolase superfamily lysophospholipase